MIWIALLLLLSDVDSWFYYIGVNEDVDVVLEQAAQSTYDMVVIDPIITERNSTDHDIAATVAMLHEADKLVIAYIDIGQAEDYRTYWQPGWRVGNPEWIVGEDPDGWTGNYPVAFWWDEWQAIWFDDLLPLILEAGFDGIYLDWVEAYSDENVVAFAEADGVDPVQEMIWFVSDIAEYTRAQRPGFIVIAQNAAELVEYDDYVDAIDAIAQEQVWFDGGADGIEGDCPLPATDADIETVAYVNSLSDACRQLHEDYPDSTLHVSSEEYLGYLTLARERGLIVFTVDYALEPDHVTWVHTTAREYGFIPFTGPRSLDRYIPPYEGD